MSETKTIPQVKLPTQTRSKARGAARLFTAILSYSLIRLNACGSVLEFLNKSTFPETADRIELITNAIAEAEVVIKKARKSANDEKITVLLDFRKTDKHGDQEIESFLQLHADILKKCHDLEEFCSIISAKLIQNRTEGAAIDAAKAKLEEPKRGRRLRLRGERLVRTQISLAPDIKSALDSAALANNTSASLIVNELLEQSDIIQAFIKSGPS